MNFKETFFLFSFIYNKISLQWLVKKSRKKLFLPFYHSISNNELIHLKKLYKVKTTKEFKSDIFFFKTHFKSLSNEEFTDVYTKKRTLEESSFFLSFDDGLSSFYNPISTILKQFNISAINFLNTDFINNSAIFFRYKVSILMLFLEQNKLSKNQEKELIELLKIDISNIIRYLKKATNKNEKSLDEVAKILKVSFDKFLKNEQPYLNENQIKELQKEGFLFGAHSKSHPYYNLLSLDNQIIETIESVEIVQEKFNLNQRFFAFPFSDFGVSKKFFNQTENENIFTFGTAGIKDDDAINHFQRIPMEYQKVYSAETIIKGELILYLLKRILNKHKVLRN